jgi:hypothetical protein
LSEFGLWGGWPFEWGGGPSSAELTYDLLRSALGGGDGGELGPLDGLDDLRIQALAVTIDAVASQMEAASLESFTAHSSHMLDIHIEEFGLDPEGDDELSRARIYEIETEELESDLVRFVEALTEISPKLSLLTIPDVRFRETMFGRAHSPRSGGGAATNDTFFPAYSDRLVLWIRYELTIADGELTIPPRIRREVMSLVLDTMPAWIDVSLTVPYGSGSIFTFQCDGGPFGTSLLDQTPMG